MTDITTWATATAEDGRRTGPEKAVAAHLLAVVKRWRERIADLEGLEDEHVQEWKSAQEAAECCAHERAGLEMLLEDLCGPTGHALVPVFKRAGRTRKAKSKGTAAAQIAEGLQEALAVARGEEQPHRLHEPTDDALVIPAALDRRAAE